jgi:hypothetical protein
METATQFDLNAAIQNWRETLSQSPGIRAENVGELESHLRDSIATLHAKGLSAEESFLIATRRLGSAPALQSEFAKVNTKEVWLDRLLWMVVGIQLFWLCTGLATNFSRMAVIGLAKGFGYQFKQPQDWGWFTFTAGIFVAARLLALIAAVWVSWTLIRRSSAIFSWVFLRSFGTGLAIIAGAGILVDVMGVSNIVFVRWFSVQEYGAMMMSASISEIVVALLTILAIAALTIYLVRRRLRSPPRIVS